MSIRQPPKPTTPRRPTHRASAIKRGDDEARRKRRLLLLLFIDFTFEAQLTHYKKGNSIIIIIRNSMMWALITRNRTSSVAVNCVRGFCSGGFQTAGNGSSIAPLGRRHPPALVGFPVTQQRSLLFSTTAEGDGNASLPTTTSTGTSSPTTYASSPLDAFRDPVDRQTRGTEPVGRPWSVTELRRKSYDDLHKLWYVLYKERNMLLTEQQLSRRRQLMFPQPERLRKVKTSMQQIKHVLGERKQVKIAAFQKQRAEDQAAAEAAAAEEGDEDEGIESGMTKGL